MPGHQSGSAGTAVLFENSVPLWLSAGGGTPRNGHVATGIPASGTVGPRRLVPAQPRNSGGRNSSAASAWWGSLVARHQTGSGADGGANLPTAGSQGEGEENAMRAAPTATTGWGSPPG